MKKAVSKFAAVFAALSMIAALYVPVSADSAKSGSVERAYV